MTNLTRTQIDLPDGRQILIRNPEFADGAALKAFFETLSPTSLRFFLPHPYTEPVIHRRIERAVNGDDLVYLAWCAERVVGYFFLWNFKDPVPLLGIGLADDFQNLRLGRKFMAILTEDARHAGCDGIELTTMLDNDRAFHVYQRAGYQLIGNVENVQGDGQVIIERAMFLPLKPGAKPMTGQHKCPD